MERKKIIIFLMFILALAAIIWIYVSRNSKQPDASQTADTGKSVEYAVKTLQPGYGDIAVKPGDLLVVNYVGFYEDGTIFSSSLASDAPYEVYIDKGEAFKGWDEGLIGMVVGEKRKLVIPPGYEGKGIEADASPDAVLYYEVELLDIK